MVPAAQRPLIDAEASSRRAVFTGTPRTSGYRTTLDMFAAARAAGALVGKQDWDWPPMAAAGVGRDFRAGEVIVGTGVKVPPLVVATAAEHETSVATKSRRRSRASGARCAHEVGAGAGGEGYGATR